MGSLRWQDFLDIIVVSYILYRIFLLMKGTRAVQLLRGMLLLAVAYLISTRLGLNTITWLVSSTATMIFVAIPIVFQPELRRALALLGQGELFRNDQLGKAEDPIRIMEELITSVRQLSARRIGALMIIERQTGLNEFIETGTPIGAYITAELITTIFFPNSPLHDGAVILRGDRIAAAGS
jgi:diadenylate cyclase